MIKVVCAIIEDDELVLVTQRSELMAEPLLWEFPGGKVELGETEEECLVREIKEELSLEVQLRNRLTPVLHHTAAKTIKLIPYTCTLVRGTVQLLEHRAFEWAPHHALRKYTWCAPDLPVVEEYLRLKLKV